MTDHDQPQSSAPSSGLGRRYAAYCGVLVISALVVTGGYFALRAMTTGAGCDCEEQETPFTPVQTPFDYSKWEKPLLALVVSGQMHGYVDPCGCSYPQYGGLPRRYNFIESLKQKKWDVVGVDLGELASLEGIQSQRLLKFDLTIKALAAMNYRAFGIGKNEILNPLGDALVQVWDKKHPYPRPLALSLAQAKPGQDLYEPQRCAPMRSSRPRT